MNASLAAACGRGDAIEINELIANGANDFSTGLQHACKNGQASIVDLLISKGAKNWNIGLIGASAGGHLALAQRMVANGANCWHSAIRAATAGGHQSLTDFIQIKNDRKEDLRNCSLYGAIDAGDLKTVNDCIGRGADGFSCGMLLACKYGRMPIINRMISAAAGRPSPNFWNNGLRGACLGGHSAIVQQMISNGASDWNSGLRSACFGGHLNPIELMISKGATDLNAGLNAAVYADRLQIAQLLISIGADDLNSSLKYAVAGRNPKLISLLLRSGATNLPYLLDGAADADFLRYLVSTTDIPRSSLAGIPNIRTAVFDDIDRFVDRIRTVLSDNGWPTVLQTIVAEYIANLR